jgi:hypothetical protein
MADTDKSNKKGDDKVIDLMLERFRVSSESEAENRKKAIYALRFRSADKYQWDEQVYNLRQLENRPTESYDQTSQFIHKVTNDMRMNMPQVKIIPNDDGDKETADVFEGMCRYIQSNSEAEVAFDTAADSQVTIGWGYIRVITEYEDDETFDQIVKIKRIANPLMVYDDPNCMEQDYSDRRYAFIAVDMPIKEFNDEYDKTYNSDMFSSIGDKQDWITKDTVRVVEYFEVKDEKEKLYQLENGDIVNDLPKGAKNYKTRDKVVPKVIWRKCTGSEVLEEKEWAGKYIPLIRVSGEELIVDGKKEFYGLMKAMIPAQKQINYWTNAATEAVALAPKSPFIMAVGQVKGLEKYWDQANSKSYPYLPYNPTEINNVVVPPPQRQSPSADISSFMVLVQAAQQGMYSATGIFPASLGQQSNESSGRAINARKIQSDVANFHFTDNMARAIRFLGRVLIDLIPKYYDTERVIRILHQDGSTEAVKINGEFQDKKGQNKIFDLSKGKYDVSVVTGPSYTTKREQALDSMIQISQANPNIWTVAPDLMIKEMDWPGADKLAERFKKTLPPQLTADDSPIPPQVQQQMEQAQQMIDMLTQQLNAAQQELESKQADIATKQADLALKQQDLEYSAQSDAMKAENDRLKIELDAQKIELEREKMQLEAARMKLDFHKTQMPQVQPEGEDMQLSKEALMAQLQALEQQEQQKAVEQEQMAINQQIMMEIEAQKEAQKSAESQALLENLVGIQQMLAGLMQSIQAPKTVVRDENGFIQGVVTQNAPIN